MRNMNVALCEWLANGWPRVGQFNFIGWPMVGYNGWPMVGRLLANGWPMVGRLLAILETPWSACRSHICISGMAGHEFGLAKTIYKKSIWTNEVGKTNFNSDKLKPLCMGVLLSAWLLLR